jgi:hypothetical protein
VTPTASCVNIEIDSTDDMQLALYRVDGDCDDFGSFVKVAANDDSEYDSVPFIQNASISQGKTYYIQLDGFSGEMGSGSLLIYECSTLAPTPAPTPSPISHPTMCSSAFVPLCLIQNKRPKIRAPPSPWFVVRTTCMNTSTDVVTDTFFLKTQMNGVRVRVGVRRKGGVPALPSVLLSGINLQIFSQNQKSPVGYLRVFCCD